MNDPAVRPAHSAPIPVQTLAQKLFHIAKNPNVSLGYLKQRESYNYFEEALGVQIVGKARQIKGTDPGFDTAAAIYIPTLPLPKPSDPNPQPPGVELLTEMIRPAKNNYPDYSGTHRHTG